MITKGIIKSIDLLGNTCTVHIPFFETAGNDPIIETATISNTPGSYNGYKVGDAVYVAFEDGRMDTPVVIGKLYLGMEKEKADPRGVSNVEESAATKKATLPADAKLTAKIDSNVPNTTVPYSSLSSIANGLNTLNTNVSQMDKDYGNRFKQVISNTNGMQSTIEQNSNSIKNSVLHKISEGGEEQDLGNGLTTKGLGWQLDENQWIIKAYDQNKENTLPAEGLDLFKIDRTTVEISAPIIRLGGYPRTTVIRYAYSDSETTHPDLYKLGITDPTLDLDKINLDEGGWTPEILPRAENKYIWQWTQTAKYEYDEDNKEWTDIVEDTTICLTGFQGERGQDGAQGISIVSQITYYALIHSDYAAGTVDAPSKDNLVVSVESGKTKEEQWSTTPPTHTDTTREEGWKYWTTTETTKSDGTITFFEPIINEDLNDVYAIAQGKTTNYYSDTDPRNAGHSVKKGDCWFQTVGSGDDGYNDTYDSGSEAASQPQGILRQWNGSEWEDIGGELVANKLTANYINALDITAKQITILTNPSKEESDDNVIFKADGLSDEPTVKIGGFTVTAKNITYGDKVGSTKVSEKADSTGVYIGTDGISIGTGFMVEAGGAPIISNIQLTDEQKKDLAAVRYYIETDTSQIIFDSTKTQTIKCYFYEQLGGYAPTLLTKTNTDFRYQLDNGSKYSLAAAGSTLAIEFRDGEIKNHTLKLYKSDTVVATTTISVIKTGESGRSVSSTTKYYTLYSKNKTPPDPTETNHDNWSASPPDFEEGYDYWESVRTVYNDNGIESYEWSTPVKNSMLSVAFIESLGITTNKIDVQTAAGEPLFVADGLKTTDNVNTPEIKLGGWIISEDGTGEKDNDNSVTGINAGWVFRNSEGSMEPLYANYNLGFEYCYFEGYKNSSYITEVIQLECPKRIDYDNESDEQFTAYIYYYMSSKGFRFRLCNTDNFNDVKLSTYYRNDNPTINSISYGGNFWFVYDFSLTQLSNFISNFGTSTW